MRRDRPLRFGIFMPPMHVTGINIRLGTGVSSLRYHHPFMLADRIVMLDHLTRLAPARPGTWRRS